MQNGCYDQCFLLTKTKKKMTEEQFDKKQSEKPDKELLEKTRKSLSKLCETGGKSLSMSVPPNVDDFDMLVCELMRRFKNAIEQ